MGSQTSSDIKNLSSDELQKYFLSVIEIDTKLSEMFPEEERKTFVEAIERYDHHGLSGETLFGFSDAEFDEFFKFANPRQRFKIKEWRKRSKTTSSTNLQSPKHTNSNSSPKDARNGTINHSFSSAVTEDLNLENKGVDVPETSSITAKVEAVKQEVKFVVPISEEIVVLQNDGSRSRILENEVDTPQVGTEEQTTSVEGHNNDGEGGQKIPMTMTDLEREVLDLKMRVENLENTQDSKDWKFPGLPRISTLIVIQSIIFICPILFADSIKGDNDWFSFKFVVCSISGISVLESVLGSFELHNLKSKLKKWLKFASQEAFLIYLKAELYSSDSSDLLLLVVSLFSTAAGVFVWASPKEIDDVALQITASGMFLTKIVELNEDIGQWVPLLVLPAVTDIVDLLRSKENRFNFLDIIFSIMYNFCLGFLISSSEYRWIKFAIIDSFSAYRICKIFDEDKDRKT